MTRERSKVFGVPAVLLAVTVVAGTVVAAGCAQVASRTELGGPGPGSSTIPAAPTASAAPSTPPSATGTARAAGTSAPVRAAAAPEASSSSVSGVDLSKSPITAIGDSVMLGASDAVHRELPGVTIDAAVSRQSTDMFDLARQKLSAGRLAPVVVIHCGTNGPTPDRDLRAILATLHDRTRVVIVTTHMATSWMAQNNQTLRRVAQDYPNVRVADWAATSEGHRNYFVADEVHPTAVGARVFANTIAEALRAA